MVLVRSEENLKNEDPYLGWESLVDKIEIIDVPGNHITMIQKPHVDILAKKIDERLKKT